MQLKLLNPVAPQQPFPDSRFALTEPNGLLAVGGCLSPERLINAYTQGIFPWYNPEEPILWWTPDPRLIVYPERVHISRSLKKTLQKKHFRISIDENFPAVMRACAAPRAETTGTWISDDILNAYHKLHCLGYAHSIETWLEDELVGGLYGVALGQVFFGESMFHTYTDASKVAFVTLAKLLQSWDYKLIDCQVRTPHLISLGAEEIPRQQFVTLLAQYTSQAAATSAWNLAG